jgi:hypothetical protein
VAEELQARMKLSREKMLHLSHVVEDCLDKADGFEFVADPNQVRLRVFDLIQEEVLAEAELDLEVRRRISSQRRGIAEGSEEWDVLYRQYYREALDRRGKVR